MFKVNLLTLSLIVPGLALAQQTPQPHMGGPRGARATAERGDLRFEQRLAQHLNLSAEQQNKVHTHLADSRVQSQGLHEKMRTLNTSLTAAIKSGNEGEIDRLSQEVANVHQQETAIHAKTTARIYATLTPDQKAKIGDHLGMLGGGPGFGPGFERGPGGAGPRARGPRGQGPQ